MTMTQQVPIAQGLFRETEDGAHLVASQCAACSPPVVTFPIQPDCPRCAGDDMKELLLPRRGTLWTFTTQQFIPKSPPYAIVETPETFRPFAVGYVEFDGLVKVEGRLTEPDAAKLEIGMEMEVVVVPFRIDDDGNQVTTFAFQPVG
jgi:uncharacterized OB-fold protein